ncbi:hypothetical protein DICSQDRAFT_138513 [Dichomitus squalens LYAD-421 SS1]|uniref:F-box domain-containing protein n=1 Tax=Dichomitus squalens (strain LYAD-421) TaxID=732165 RepID=R7SX60_DICSQ|nr:uncharacterized protein DICSQDRAFT_138513 [Dichomitus squalens LYAD-421 SS1]EJF59577.1 hypothetical protein DICSQDRAFT_138513 [Dichomitus squalens LYAD-421 SS1]
MVPYIPPDIIDIILEYVDGNAAQLCTCALVCHVWLEASRRRLFQHLRFYQPASYDSFIRHVVHREEMQRWLASARTLMYAGDRDPDNIAIERQFKAKSNRGLCELAGQLPNLHTLALFELDWSEFSHPRAHLALSQFGRIRELLLVDCTFSSLGALRDCITGLTALRNLFLLRIGSEDPVRFLNGIHSRPMLETLAIDFDEDSDSNTFLQWLSQTPTVSSLRRLAITPRHLDLQWEAFTSSITCLDISLNVTNEDFCLAPFTLLESLTIRGGSDKRKNWLQLSTNLRSVSGRLRTLFLSLDIYWYPPPPTSPVSYPEVDDRGLELLEQVLEGTSFASLHTVEFYFRRWQIVTKPLNREQAQRADAHIKDLVCKKLHKLCKRGVHVKIVVHRVPNDYEEDPWEEARCGFGRMPFHAEHLKLCR